MFYIATVLPDYDIYVIDNKGDIVRVYDWADNDDVYIDFKGQNIKDIKNTPKNIINKVASFAKARGKKLKI